MFWNEGWKKLCCLLACFFFPLKWNNAVQDQARHGRLYRQQSQLSRLPSLLSREKKWRKSAWALPPPLLLLYPIFVKTGGSHYLQLKVSSDVNGDSRPIAIRESCIIIIPNCGWTWREYLSMRVFPSYPRHQPSNYFRRRHANVRLHHTDSTSVFSCWTLWNYLLFLLQCFTDIGAAKALLGAASASGWGDVACVAWSDSMRRPIHRPLFPSINICTGSAHV